MEIVYTKEQAESFFLSHSSGKCVAVNIDNEKKEVDCYSDAVAHIQSEKPEKYPFLNKVTDIFYIEKEDNGTCKLICVEFPMNSINLTKEELVKLTDELKEFANSTETEYLDK